MTARPPADVGMPLDEVDTPALIIELDPFEANLARMAEAAGAAGVRLRPHAKTHKCAIIALRQIALGAVGVCCQKVSEAEALVEGGVRDVLVTNEIVGERKIAHLAALAREAKLTVCVDSAENVAALDGAAARAGATLDVLVEVDVGAHRCGVPPGTPAVELAERPPPGPSWNFQWESWRAPRGHRRGRRVRQGDRGHAGGARDPVPVHHRRRHGHVSFRGGQRALQ